MKSVAKYQKSSLSDRFRGFIIPQSCQKKQTLGNYNSIIPQSWLKKASLGDYKIFSKKTNIQTDTSRMGWNCSNTKQRC